MHINSPILQIGDVLLSPDIITEPFCCDLAACHGACCVEGDAGAPLTTAEERSISAAVTDFQTMMTPAARALTAGTNGIACHDCEGELVTRTVAGRDCVFAIHDGGCCLCVIEKARRAGMTHARRPLSCELYPIRESRLHNGLTALNLHRWNICQAAHANGQRLQMPVYRFVESALTRRFGRQWFDELQAMADMLKTKGTL